MLISSAYMISSDAVNRQIDELNEILKKYDEGGMLIGEAPLHERPDFLHRPTTSRSSALISIISHFPDYRAGAAARFSLPVILLSPSLKPAIAAKPVHPLLHERDACRSSRPILISTIQLGSTVDYAILMTTRYLQNRRAGSEQARGGQQGGRRPPRSRFSSAASASSPRRSAWGCTPTSILFLRCAA